MYGCIVKVVKYKGTPPPPPIPPHFRLALHCCFVYIKALFNSCFGYYFSQHEQLCEPEQILHKIGGHY